METRLARLRDTGGCIACRRYRESRLLGVCSQCSDDADATYEHSTELLSLVRGEDALWIWDIGRGSRRYLHDSQIILLSPLEVLLEEIDG